MQLRLLIKGDAIQYGENDFYCPCRTIDIKVADNVIDKEHEHIIGVEIEPQESDDEWERVKMIDVNGNTHKVTFKKEIEE